MNIFCLNQLSGSRSARIRLTVSETWIDVDPDTTGKNNRKVAKKGLKTLIKNIYILKIYERFIFYVKK